MKFAFFCVFFLAVVRLQAQQPADPNYLFSGWVNSDLFPAHNELEYGRQTKPAVTLLDTASRETSRSPPSTAPRIAHSAASSSSSGRKSMRGRFPTIATATAPVRGCLYGSTVSAFVFIPASWDG